MAKRLLTKFRRENITSHDVPAYPGGHTHSSTCTALEPDPSGESAVSSDMSKILQIKQITRDKVANPDSKNAKHLRSVDHHSGVRGSDEYTVNVGEHLHEIAALNWRSVRVYPLVLRYYLI